MFGGGGTIAYEAALLGADAYSIDSNELAVFTQNCLLSQPATIQGRQLPKAVKESGERVLSNLKELTKPLFPKRADTFAYFWTYSATCGECGYKYLLSKRRWLSRKKGRLLAISVQTGVRSDTATVVNVAGANTPATAWNGRNGNTSCPSCSALSSRINVKDTEDVLVATATKEVSGKSFSSPSSGCLPSDAYLHRMERKLLTEMSLSLPCSPLPKWSGIVNPAIYGIETHADFLGKRQRLVLLCLIKCIRDEYKALLESSNAASADAVVGILSGLVDQLIDWNCRLSMWIPQNEQVGRAFSGPGVAMLWDYVETDPVMDGPANLWKKLERIVAGTEAACQLPRPVKVAKAYAQAMPFPDMYFDAIVTDPPYYDNIYYNALADFFYSWKRLLLRGIVPHLFENSQTDFTRELVASKFRSGSAQAAHSDYCEQLTLAIAEAERVLRPDGVFSLVYSHSSLNGWEAIVKAYRRSGMLITSVQPLSIERKARPRAMTSDAVNTCVVFVAHKVPRKKSPATLAGVCDDLAKKTKAAIEELSQLGWCESDMAIAAYALGVGMLCNVKTLLDCDSDAEALRSIANVIHEQLPIFKLSLRDSL
jgi:putative DNA methylase